MLLVVALAAPLRAQGGGQQEPVSPQALAAWWDAADSAVPSAGAYAQPALVDHAALVARLGEAVKLAPGLFRAEEIGQSVEGRPISMVSFGRGEFHVLLWSQMHGDEPSATQALLDILRYVAARRAEPATLRLLDALTVHLVPMLNPDGAERFQRRNAQGIDVNRDALLLQSPEGQALKALRDRLKPALGFNLHNQGWRTSAGKTGKPASFSLLAVAFDEARTETPERTLAKRTCSVLTEVLESFAPGQIARYDDEFEVRAFGDNITKWGTPVVLIETGPYQGDSADRELVRLNFVAILAALDALAGGRVAKADPARYESLPVNESGLFTVLVRNASIVVGTGIAPFTGDVGLASSRVVRRGIAPAPVREAAQVFRVEDLGDLRVFSALETIDATGLVLASHPDWAPGAEIPMADWRAFKADPPIATGASVRLVLLREVRPGVCQVVRVLPAEIPLGR